MGTYYVSVTVEVNFEVEADSREEAELQGWDWETYKHHADVFSIEVEDISEDDEEDGE